MRVMPARHWGLHVHTYLPTAPLLHNRPHLFAPPQDQQARKRSIATQAQLRQRVVLMSLDEEQRAIRRQLLESGSLDEAFEVGIILH